MPKKGFKSFSFKEELYNHHYSKFKTNKKELSKKGINSFSAYLVYILNQGTVSNLIPKNFRFEKIYKDQNTIILKDYQKNKIIEIAIRKNSLFCQTDKKTDCIHVGFAYSFTDVIKNMQESD